MIPGELILADSPITCNAGRERSLITVKNTGDRPVQVGSHYHFAEANPALTFDRAAAYGKRLDIPAGTAVRFEPGDSTEVPLIDFAGNRTVYGFRGHVNGPLDPAASPTASTAASPAASKEA